VGRGALLEKIQGLMPSCSMLEPQRLEQLMKQAVAFQLHNCKYHNVYLSEYSLLEDHHCSKQMLPTKCVAVLKRHKDEVWIIKFSNSGHKLATIGKDNVIVIWQFTKINMSTNNSNTAAADSLLNNNTNNNRQSS
jgi:WD40 repeat protein